MKVRIASTTTLPNRAPIRGEAQYSIIYDIPKIRIDVQRLPGSAHQRYIFDQKTFIYYSDARTDQGKPLAVVMGPLADTSPYRLARFDPRLLGMLPCEVGALHAMSLNLFVGQADRVSSEISDEQRDGIETRKVSYDRSDGAKCIAWLAPKLNNALLEGTCEITDKGSTVVDRVKNTIREVAHDIYFPTAVTYTRTVNSVVVIEEVVVISDIQLDGPVDQKAFAMESLGIPPGADVIESPPNPGGSRIWNGTKLISGRSNVDLLESTSTHSGKTNLRWILVGANLLIIGILLVAIALHRGVQLS